MYDFNINTALHIGFGGIILPLTLNKYTSISLLEAQENIFWTDLRDISGPTQSFFRTD